MQCNEWSTGSRKRGRKKVTYKEWTMGDNLLCFSPQNSDTQPTFLYSGVQLRDLDCQPVNAVLERVGTQIKGVGLIEQFAKYILCMFTWKRTAERDRNSRCERKKETFCNYLESSKLPQRLRSNQYNGNMTQREVLSVCAGNGISYSSL